MERYEEGPRLDALLRECLSDTPAHTIRREPDTHHPGRGFSPTCRLLIDTTITKSFLIPSDDLPTRCQECVAAFELRT